MKIALCINRSSLGGVSTSTYILASGLRMANYNIDKLNDRLVGIYEELIFGKINSSKQKVEIISGQEQK